MLQSVYAMRGLSIGARDGALGHVDYFLFDDRTGTIRYLVVRTGNWLLRRRVLIAPEHLGAINTALRTLDVALTRQQIADSPAIETNPPVSQQYTAADLQDDATMLGWDMLPGPWYRTISWCTTPWTTDDVQRLRKNVSRRGDLHLRSTREVIGYQLRATDGTIGHVVDLLLDETTWTIRSLVVDTSGWWPGKHVVLPWKRIKGIRWPISTVEVDVSRETVRRHPVYDPADVRPRSPIQNGQTRS